MLKYVMRNLIDIIYESTENIIECGEFSVEFSDEYILERNETIFPKQVEPQNGEEPKPTFGGKFIAQTGDHAQQRQRERHVSNQEIINALFGAYSDIDKLYKNGELVVNKNNSSRFLIVDVRKGFDKKTVCVVGYISFNKNPQKLKHPRFVIATVFRGDDFAAAKRNDQKQCKIFLY